MYHIHHEFMFEFNLLDLQRTPLYGEMLRAMAVAPPTYNSITTANAIRRTFVWICNAGIYVRSRLFVYVMELIEIIDHNDGRTGVFPECVGQVRDLVGEQNLQHREPLRRLRAFHEFAREVADMLPNTDEVGCRVRTFNLIAESDFPIPSDEFTREITMTREEATARGFSFETITQVLEELGANAHAPE
jgi:hypothetical protein